MNRTIEAALNSIRTEVSLLTRPEPSRGAVVVISVVGERPEADPRIRIESFGARVHEVKHRDRVISLATAPPMLCGYRIETLILHGLTYRALTMAADWRELLAAALMPSHTIVELP